MCLRNEEEEIVQYACGLFAGFCLVFFKLLWAFCLFLDLFGTLKTKKIVCAFSNENFLKFI
jgi:hypothetical protein